MPIWIEIRTGIFEFFQNTSPETQAKRNLLLSGHFLAIILDLKKANTARIKMIENPKNSVWLQNVQNKKDGYEAQAFDRYANRLVELAKSRLPLKIRPRVDAADIVQSAFFSFFSRHRDGRFMFNESEDIWRLLAAITYRKVQKKINYHKRKRRDVNAESNASSDGKAQRELNSPTASSLAVFNETYLRIANRLPKKHQQVLQMRIEGFSAEEISGRLGVSVRTVNRGLHLIRKIATDSLESN